MSMMVDQRRIPIVFLDPSITLIQRLAVKLVHSNRRFLSSTTSNADTFRCSDRALANHKAVTDSFRSIYSINSGKAPGQAVAVGRYSEDVYYGGNPWYLSNLAAAEQLYDAIYTWNRLGSVTVNSVSLAFFRDLVPSIATGTYSSSTSTFTSIINAVKIYADGYVNIVAQYAEADGSLAEQFSRSNGSPLSAADLTWSYAAFLTMAARRQAIVPYPWIVQTATNVPGACTATTAYGTYSTAPTGTFPANQTPTNGIPTTTSQSSVSTSSTSAASTTTTTSCATATSVAVTFNVLATTQFGQTIKLVGNNAAIGNWNTANAVALSASSYTSSNPLWKVTVNFPAGTALQFKFINVASGGAVTWERDPNRVYTVPVGCATGASISTSWQA